MGGCFKSVDVVFLVRELVGKVGGGKGKEWIFRALDSE
jgi:hypothetical protein